MPRVDIFAINFFPEVTGTAPYTTDLAMFLESQNWDVSITTGYPHYPEWEKMEVADPPDLRVTRYRHFIPKIPNAIGRGLMDASWFLTSLRCALQSNPSATTLAVVPNLSGALLGLIHARRSSGPLILWVQDVMGSAARESGTSGGRWVGQLVQLVESAIARRADAVLVAGDSFRPYFISAGIPDSRIVRIRNWGLVEPPPGGATTSKSDLGFDDSRFLALHSGNMGAKQGLSVILDAAFTAPQIQFVLQGDGSERSALLAEAASRQLTNVLFMPTLPREQLADLLTAADALLVTQRETVKTMSLPSKLSTYSAVGKPVIASVADGSETARIVRSLAQGIVVTSGDGAALATALQTLRDSPGEPVPCATPVENDRLSSLDRIAVVLAHA